MKKCKLLLILSFVLMLGACGNNPSEVVVIDKDVKTDVDKKEEVKENDGFRYIEVVQEKSQEEQSEIMKELDDLLNQNPSSLAFSQFVDKNIKGLSKENGTKMVLALEENLKKNIEKVYGELPNYEQKLYDYDYKEVLKDIDKVKEQELKKFLQEFKDSNYIFGMNEGMYQVYIDYRSLVKYSPYLTEDISEYFKLKSLNSDEYYAEDGGVAIPYEELRQRLVIGDQFLSKYGDSKRVREAAMEYVNYLSFYLYGDNHIPAFDYDTNKLKDEILESYRKIDLNDANSYLSKTFKSYMPLLEKDKYTLTDEINNFRKKVETDFMKEYNMTYEELYNF
ncbi:hypothetical protein IZY60_08650 [Lutibacter sp. B2]|nr:hypothetical protein [Lutibacter sp. B2]